MGHINYDALEGYLRVAEAAPDTGNEVAQCIALFAALERELDVALEKSLPRVTNLGGVSFANKAKFLHAAWRGTPKSADDFYNVVYRFGAMRNAVAHHNLDETAATRKALLAAYKVIDPISADNPSLDQIAKGICAYLADGPIEVQLKRISDHIGQ